MGSILAMAAVVAVVAGVATVATSKLHNIFTGGAPNVAGLQKLVDDWRSKLRDAQPDLLRLKDKELDLLGAKLAPERSLLKGSNREAGYIQTVYKENIAHYVRQQYPRAKTGTELSLIQTKTAEIVYRTAGAERFVTLNGKPFGVMDNDVLRSQLGEEELARRVPQRDGRTIHIDAKGKTLAIAVIGGLGQADAPRLYEFVDVDSDRERLLLEVMSFDFLLSQNLT